MISYRITSVVLGGIIAAVIVLLIRKDFLHTRYAVMWLGFAAGAAFFGIFPQVNDWIALALGVKYPPILFVIVAVAVVLIKMLTMDIERSKSEIQIRALNERMAIFEGETMKKLLVELTELSKRDKEVEKLLRDHNLFPKSKS